MPATLKYALRYAPLLILALLLIPLRVYTAGKGQQNSALLSQDRGLPPFSPGSALYSVTLLPSGEVWAVGGSFIAKCDAHNATKCFPAPFSGIILHYSDSVWVPANVTDSLRAPLLSVSLDSPQDGWAVGWAGVLVHYHGHAWSIAPDSAKFKQNLLGVSMLSPSDGWAVGYSGIILHYDGKQWTQVPGPTTVDLRSIAMPSPQEGWAVGDSGTILHYHHGTWSLISSPTHNTLNNVAMLSTAEGWAVGKQGTILHYRAEDGSWQSVSSDPNSYRDSDLYGVAMSSIRAGWIIGDYQFLTYSSEVWREPGSIGNFSRNVQSSQFDFYSLNLYSIALSPSGEGWAVGRMNAYDKASSHGNKAIVILHYQGSKWFVSLLT